MASRRSARLVAFAGSAVAVLGVAFVVRTLVANWSETRQLIADADMRWIGAALPVALVGMTGVGVPWTRAIHLVGGEATVGRTLRWYFPGQMGKYVPGGIWPVIGRGELATKGGLPRAVAYSSVGLSLATTYLSAVLLAVITLPLAFTALVDTDPPLWVFMLLPAGLVALHPRVLTRLLALGEKVLGKSVNVVLPSWRDSVALVAMHVPAWLLIGGATWCVVRALTPGASLIGVIFATSLSWVVGFVVIGVPGGIGVREATFAAILASSVPAGVGPAAALAARLVFIIADTIGAAGAVVGRARQRDTADVT